MSSRRKQLLERRIESLVSELERLETVDQALPEEDPFENGDILYFEKMFGGSTKYNYAFLRFNNGLWAGTGPKAPKYYTWDELRDFLSEGVDTDSIWYVSEFRHITDRD